MQKMTKREKPAARRSPAPQQGYRTPAPEVVDPVWLLKAGALTIGFGILCAYIAVCVLFYKSQWQIVLHPSRTASHTPADFGLQAEDVTLAGKLHGWWIPAEQTSDPTVLMLASGDGSAADSLGRAKTFHNAHLNVLLFDYRGYGASSEPHPTEAMMEADAASALAYLQQMRSVPLDSTIVYGTGVGASLATKLCSEQKAAALILEAPTGDLSASAAQDSRARLVPFHMLFHEAFPLATPLATLKTPKLLVAYSRSRNMREAGDPKMIVDLPSAADEKDFRNALQRFLDSYVTHPATIVLPVGD